MRENRKFCESVPMDAALVIMQNPVLFYNMVMNIKIYDDYSTASLFST